jgi:ABC-2 type transport system ATP-binding protein
MRETERPIAAAQPAGVVASLENVSKSYGGVAALRNVNFAIREGETVALLGPNGAGKTTMINVLLGLRRVDGGTVRVFGDPPLSARARQLIGITQQESAFPTTLRVGEVVSFVSAQYCNAVPQSELLERFGLLDVVRRQIGGLSGGQRRRLVVALAFAGGPRLVFLDEPTRAVVVSKGNVLANDSIAAIRAGVRTRRVSVTSDVPLTGFAGVTSTGDRYSFVTLDADAAVRELVARNVPFRDIEVGAVSLEDAFLLIVGKTS